LSTCDVYVCDRCQCLIDLPDDTTPGSVRIAIPSELTGHDGESHAPGLHYCKPCQPLVAALLAGLFRPDVIAALTERELGHSEEWLAETISLADTLAAYVSRTQPVFTLAGADRGE